MDGEDGLTRAVERYGRELLRYCHHILCDYHEAQDVTQTAFLKLWERRGGAPEGEALRPWLYRVCYNGCVDVLRRRRRLGEMPPERAAEEAGMDLELRLALERLTSQERALIFQRVMEGWTYRELARVYRVPASTLRKRYERARDKLAQLLREGE